MKNITRKTQEAYYRSLYQEHSGTPMAVSSESLAHKELRFREICRLFQDEDAKSNFSVHDVGMGLSDLYHFISTHFPYSNINYSGSDILEEFVEASKERFPNSTFFHRDLTEEGNTTDTYDYVVLSGVFHQRRTSTIPEWESFWQTLLLNCWNMSRKGIAFNFVSPFVDYYQDNIYYCNIYKLIDFVVSRMSRYFTVNHNYALYEFTILVYKPEYTRELFPQDEFAKYFR
jgi:hypothetical protein